MPVKAPTLNTSLNGSVSPTLGQVQDIVANVTGIDPEEITPNTFLEELSLEDMPRIIGKVNLQFGVVLRTKDIMQDCETIQDLVHVIDEEQELG